MFKKDNIEIYFKDNGELNTVDVDSSQYFAELICLLAA